MKLFLQQLENRNYFELSIVRELLDLKHQETKSLLFWFDKKIVFMSNENMQYEL
jgi:hypothetical protein